MASDRLYRALDLLAGVAGQEIDEARQLKMDQKMRLEALQRMQEKEQADDAFRTAELQLQKSQLIESERSHKVTERRLSHQDDEVSRLQERNQNVDKQIATIKAEADLKIANARNLALSEAALSEAIDAGYSGDDLLPFYEKLRLNEQMYYGRPITPLPQKSPEPLPPPTQDEETSEGGDGFGTKIFDFLSGGKYSESKKQRAMQNVATTPDTTANPADTLYTEKSFQKWLNSQGNQ